MASNKRGHGVTPSERARRRYPVAVAAAWTLAGCALCAALPAVAAQAPAAQSVERVYAIPAGPLQAALNRFGAEAGILLSFTAEQTAGRYSRGVQGRFDSAGALSALLAGSGLQAVAQPGGGYSLRALPQKTGRDITLAPVKVNAAVTRAASEGSGSYTTAAATTALGMELSLRQTPQSVTVMTQQRIEDQALHEILEVLDQAAGITVNQGGPIGSDSNTIYARGFAVENFQVDGINRSSRYGFRDDVSDMAVFDRVEIVRGATGLLSGTGEPSATINLVRKKPTAEPAVQVSGQLGSHDHYRLDADASGPLSAGGGVRGRLVGAYQDSGAFIDRQQLTKKVLYGVVETDLGAATVWRLGAEFQRYEADQAARAGFPLYDSRGGKTHFSRAFNTATRWSYLSRENRALFSTLEHSFANDWSLRIDAEKSWRKYDDVLGYAAGGRPDPVTGAGVSIWPGRWAAEPEQLSLGFIASGPFELFGRSHQLMAGYSWSDAGQEGHSYPLWYLDNYDRSIPNIFDWRGDMPEPALAPNADFEYAEKQGGGYLAARFSVSEALSAIVGVRTTDWRRRTETTPFATGIAAVDKRSETGVVTPYLGVVYDLSEHWSAYASYTSIFKAQSQRQADGTYLDPVEGKSYEIGLKGEFYAGRLNTSAALFKVQQDNFAVADGALRDPDGNQAYRAADGTESKGVELEISGELAPGWQIGSGYSYAPAKGRDDRLLTPYVPKSTFKLFSTYQLDGRWEALTLGGNLRWQSATYARAIGPNGEDFVQDDYALVDLLARYQFTDALSASLNLNNLFDKTYYTSMSFTGFYGEPRHALLTVQYRVR